MAGDIIDCTAEDGHVCHGVARRFLRVPAAAGAVQFYVLVSTLRGAGAARYAAPRDDAAEQLVRALRLRGACPYFRRGDFIHVVDEKLWQRTCGHAPMQSEPATMRHKGCASAATRPC